MSDGNTWYPLWTNKTIFFERREESKLLVYSVIKMSDSYLLLTVE